MAYPRNRTNQGGNPWLARKAPGLPNTQAMGLNNWKPQQGGPRSGGQANPKDWRTPPGGQPGPSYQGGGRPGANPNTLIGSEGHDPLSKLRYWAAQGWLVNPNMQGFKWAGDNALQQFLQNPIMTTGPRPNPGGKPSPTPIGGAPGPWIGPQNPPEYGWEPWLDDMVGPPVQEGPPGGEPGPVNGGGQGGGQGQGGGPQMDTLPLDPAYMGQMKSLLDMLAARRMSAQNAYDTGLSELNFIKDQGNRSIDESMAARGLYGSGVERRSERLLGNDVLLQQLGLQNQLTGQQSQAEIEMQQGLMEALLALAQRQALSGTSAAPRY